MSPLIRAVVLSVVCLVAVPAAWGQQDDVNPDRPGVSTSPQTVTRGAFQLETGVDYSRERSAGEPNEHRTAVAALARYGLLDGVELRLALEAIVFLRGPDDATNVGDLLLAAKIRVLEGQDGSARPAFSLLPTIKLPTAPDPIGSEKVDISLAALMGWSFGRLSLTGNAGIGAIGQDNGYLVQGQVIGAVAWEAIDKLSLLGEVFWNSPEERHGDDFVGATAGVSYRVTRDVAVDAAVIVSLAGRGPDYRIQSGITVRFWP
jgi:hypothetical protein